MRNRNFNNEVTVNNHYNGGNMIMKHEKVGNIGAFGQMVEEELSKVYGNYDVTVKEVAKNKGVILTGITVKPKEERISPIVYLESYFADYLSGRELKDIIRDICLFFENNRMKDRIDISEIISFESVKDRLYFKLINLERNRERLNHMPYVSFLDLAVAFYISVETDDSTSGSVAVDNKLVESWGIADSKVLFGIAKKNSEMKLKGSVVSMMSLIGHINGDMADMEDEECPMYIATNSEKLDGAGVILYEGLLKGFYEKIGKSFYILPSSTHEVIFVPEAVGTDVNCLKAMVAQVNRTEVGEEEILSDNVYRYNPDKDLIEIM